MDIRADTSGTLHGMPGACGEESVYAPAVGGISAYLARPIDITGPVYTMTARIEMGDPGTDAKQIAIEWLPLHWGHAFPQALRDKIGAGLLDGSLQASMAWGADRVLMIMIQGSDI